MNLIKNKYIFFGLRVLKDIFNPTQWELCSEFSSKELGQYYFKFTEQAMENQKGGQKSIVFDEDGIPMSPTYIDVKDKDYVYFPITIGQVGLAVFHTFVQSRKQKDKERFLKFVTWFAENGKFREDLGYRWLTDVALPQYHNSGPWQSAFAQGRGISVLLRGFQLTGEKYFATIAEQALWPFNKPVIEGGVTQFTEFGPFYEEYTAEVPTLVLNGMIFSLCGLYDFVRVFPDNKLGKELFWEGVSTLENILPKYNLGYWSQYNLCEADWYPEVDPATVTYQHLHISQLNLLYQITGKKIFLTYAHKFKQQLSLINILHMYVAKYRALKNLNRL